jgi:hypothetical protein
MPPNAVFVPVCFGSCPRDQERVLRRLTRIGCVQANRKALFMGTRHTAEDILGIAGYVTAGLHSPS